VKAFGWDDGLMVLAMVFNIWFAICGLAGSIAGIGKRFDQFDSVEDAHTALLVRPSVAPSWLLSVTYTA
jgi:hypothetical protein